VNPQIENISFILISAPLFFFIVAVTFRLLDNSALLFLQKEILVSSSNVSRKLLQKEIEHNEDPVFTKKLKRALLFRNLHQTFLGLMAISLPILIAHLF
tara:strand:- start:178 stop:474 length:297 start_codon:yes stop_codon:yes gene_type:complete